LNLVRRTPLEIDAVREHGAQMIVLTGDEAAITQLEVVVRVPMAADPGTTTSLRRSSTRVSRTRLGKIASPWSSG